MPITLPCPCGRKLQAKDEWLGKKIRCPACGVSLAVVDLPSLQAVETLPEALAEQTATVAGDKPRQNRPPRILEEDPSPEEIDEEDASSPPPPQRAEASSTRTILLTLMMGYFPYLAFVLLLASGVLAWSIWKVGQNSDIVNKPFAIFFTFFAIFVGWTILWILIALRVLVFPPKVEADPFEIELPEKWQERLIDLVDGVARKRNLPTPDIIRLHASDVAHVREDKKGRRILVIGGLAVAAFSPRALSGIIAHELGHFGGGDTTLSRLAMHWHRVIVQLEIQFWYGVGMSFNPFVWLIQLYHIALGWAWGRDSRAREYTADRHEIQLVGKKEAAAALVLIYVFEHLPYAQLVNVAESAVKMNERLDHIFTEQVTRLRAASWADWDKALRKALSSRTNWLDSHPCLKERLSAMGVSPKKALRSAMDMVDESATELFANWPAVEKFLTGRIMEIVREIYAEREEYNDTMTKLMRWRARQ